MKSVITLVAAIAIAAGMLLAGSASASAHINFTPDGISTVPYAGYEDAMSIYEADPITVAPVSALPVLEQPNANWQLNIVVGVALGMVVIALGLAFIFGARVSRPLSRDRRAER